VVLARESRALNKKKKGFVGMDDGGQQGAFAMELLERYWHALFFVFAAASIVRNRGLKNDFARKLKAVVGLGALLVFSYKLERFLTGRVLGPLLKKLFGDNDDLRRRVANEEATIRQILEEARNERKEEEKEQL